jgi:hypothetical protein
VLGAVMCACTSGGGGGLPVATPAQFPDLAQIAQLAKSFAASSGDATPRGVAIVKSSRAAVFDHASGEDADRNREMYFVRIDGDFTGCPECRGPSGHSFGPTRWISFDWDPVAHGSDDFGYGSAPHLEEFGTVYAVALG